MNSVKKISFLFSGENEHFFHSLYGRWDSYWMNLLERSTDRLLVKYDDVSCILELDALELEIGTISEEDFERQFLRIYEEKLENALIEQLYGNTNQGLGRIPLQKKLSEFLFQFLLHGSLPWNIAAKYKDINRLFLEVISKETKAFKIFLQTYGHYTSLQQRLIFQLDDEALKEGIRIVVPGESNFIISYIHLVQSKYERLHSPQIRRSRYQKVIWTVVYAYVLTNRSSFFNKKSFLQQTIQQLALQQNTSYGELLHLLLIVPEQEPSYPTELLSLLNALKIEDEQILESGRIGWMKLYEIVKVDGRGRAAATWDPVRKNRLVMLLKKEDSNYLFLQLLQEPEIIDLVKLLVPQHYIFIREYTQELEQQKDKGILQGIAGSEFRIVKWQIIFPVLLENSGTGFNRRHFVLRVLKNVAARYNLSVLDILSYLHLQKVTFRMNKELMLIFEDWYYRLNVENKQLDAEPVINFQQIVTILRNMQELPYTVHQKWKRFLATETKRNELLQLLSEGEHRQLVRVLYQQSSPFILAYAEAIELQKDKGVLQGKSSGNFRALKWQFIHAVLLEPQQQVFNKRYFVENVLQRLAAHHNLKTEELLDFFYHELLKKGFALPFDLIKVMETLYIEKIKKHERKKNSDIEKSNVNRQSVEVNTKQLLLRYFGNDAGLVSMILALSKQHDFVRFIQPVLQVEAVLRRFIFQKYHITTNIKQLLSLLVYFSKEHHTMSQITILMKVITFLFSQLKNEKQQLDFERQILQLANDNSLLKEATILKSEWLQQAEVIENIEEIAEDADVQPTFIPNGGLILIAPFLPRLFSLLGLTEVGKFKDQAAQIRAVFLMQYAVFGTTEFPEHELQLNKLLSSLKIGIPIPRYIELTEEEVKTVDGMLTGAIQHWSKVKSIEGLREGFLQREGKLEAEDESYQLIMEEKSYDMLLDSLPWSFKTVKFSWMEKGINVKWR